MPASAPSPGASITALAQAFIVSLGVLASAAVVWLGLNLADPIIGLVITAVILQITWESWRTVSKADPDEMLHEEHDH